MRAAGILMPIFSLPSEYGIGTLGKKAYEFVDFLNKAGQKYWQILPICPTSFGDSPYQSFSSYAGNPYFIDLDVLENDGYLLKNEYTDIEWGKGGIIDYSVLYQKRFAVLKKAYLRFMQSIPEDYNDFLLKNNNWLADYALFMAIKNANDGKSWDEWPEQIKLREKDALIEAEKLYGEDVEFFKVLQYFFNKQWKNLKSYANALGIKIIGDIPIYVAYDSADVWCEPEQFYLDDELKPIEVAGCPPDIFSKTGQLWGNPLYNWKYMKNDTTPFDWWCRRIEYTLNLYDIIRIDHFRGFESYYAVPFSDVDATNGKWRKGPGIAFFNYLKDKFGKMDIIAEDLGFMTSQVKEMLDSSGFPGMKVLQFAFDANADSEHLPHNCIGNCVVYTGTHDNDTVVGWQSKLKKEDLNFLKKYLRAENENKLNWAMIHFAFATSSDTVIIPMQDYLGLGSEARINSPSTLGNNWRWQIDGSCINDWLAKIIREVTETYRRLPDELKKASN